MCLALSRLADNLLHVQEEAVRSTEDRALRAGRPLRVEHPLLDKVKACSSDPDMAADFFTWMLSPYDTWRLGLAARDHPYLQPTYSRMLQALGLPDFHSSLEGSASEQSAQPGALLILRTVVVWLGTSVSGACRFAVHPAGL